MILMGKMGQEAFGVVDGPPAEAPLRSASGMPVTPNSSRAFCWAATE